VLLARGDRGLGVAASALGVLGGLHAGQLVVLGGGQAAAHVLELALQGEQVLGVAHAAAVELAVDLLGPVAEAARLQVGGGDGGVGAALVLLGGGGGLADAVQLGVGLDAGLDGGQLTAEGGETVVGALQIHEALRAHCGTSTSQVG